MISKFSSLRIVELKLLVSVFMRDHPPTFHKPTVIPPYCRLPDLSFFLRKYKGIPAELKDLGVLLKIFHEISCYCLLAFDWLTEFGKILEHIMFLKHMT